MHTRHKPVRLVSQSPPRLRRPRPHAHAPSPPRCKSPHCCCVRPPRSALSYVHHHTHAHTLSVHQSHTPARGSLSAIWVLILAPHTPGTPPHPPITPLIVIHTGGSSSSHSTHIHAIIQASSSYHSLHSLFYLQRGEEVREVERRELLHRRSALLVARALRAMLIRQGHVHIAQRVGRRRLEGRSGRRGGDD